MIKDFERAKDWFDTNKTRWVKLGSYCKQGNGEVKLMVKYGFKGMQTKKK